MTDLPTGWTETTLKSICSKIVDGSHNPPRAVTAGKPMLSARNVRERAIHLDEFRFISEDDFEQEHARTQAQAGDVLLTIVGAIGRTAVVPSGSPAFALQRSVAVLRPAAMESRALAYALEAPDVQKYLTDNARGTAQKGIYLGTLATVKVKVPPAEEQQRIADKLDTVLARVDACRDRLTRVAPLLKRFRQSVLAAATSGRLTANVEPAFDSRLESLASLGAVSGGLTKNAKRDDLPMRRPYLRVANVHANELRLGDVTDIGLTDAEFAKTKLVAGDLLIVEGNGSIEQIGRVAMWSGEIANCCHQNHLIRWRAGARVLPKFVLCFLLSPEGRRQIEAVASSTTGLHTLSVSKVGELQLPVPSLELQTEIVRRVETLFAYADRMDARLAQARTAVDRLTPSMLAKAFRGELVPQDPADEPAAELLARLGRRAADNGGPTREGSRRGRRLGFAQDTP